jgi:hypothetical protein
MADKILIVIDCLGFMPVEGSYREIKNYHKLILCRLVIILMKKSLLKTSLIK